MPTTAERIAATVTTIAAIIPGIAFPDDYDVLATAPGSPATDSRGNRTASASPTVIESGKCLLKAAGAQSPRERAIADRVNAVAPYTILLPRESTVAATNRIRVNATRTFEVIGVVSLEGFGALTSVVCQEIGA